MFKLIFITLLNNIILFINNYFIYPKLIVILRDKRITICEIIKSNRRNLPKLLIKIKQEFIKNISYDVLIIII